MTRIEEMIQKMIKRFDVKEIRKDLYGISQKIDAHAVLIKKSATMNLLKPIILSGNTI